MYVYQADTYCDACGARIADELDRAGTAPADPGDEHTYDSDDYPKGPLAEEPTDGPDHCASAADCLDAVELSGYGLHRFARLHGAETRRIGALLSDGLTDDGAAYLHEMLAERPRTYYQAALHAYWREAFSDELAGVL